MRRIRIGGAFALAWAVLLATAAQAEGHFSAEAIRLNNRGVALMGQQFTERAAARFAEAMKADPSMAQAAINDGIALMTLQKLTEAEEALKKALKLEPANPQAWYNLGLAQHADNEVDAALESFQQAVRFAPRDADSLYYEGVCYQEKKDYAKAIAIFQQALQINPLHASAEFGMARALQRSGRTEEARAHFKIFQHMTSTKIASAIGLAYGEQGHYSTALPVEMPQEIQRTMIPVRLEPRVMEAGAREHHETGGACMMDVTGDGSMDLVLMESGAQAVGILHRQKDGSFNRMDVVAAGLKLAGHGVACAVGDFDGDGKNDLAVVTDDTVALFRNLGGGKFEDVTKAAGLVPMNRPTGIGFLDFDHDGDLDLFITGSPLKPGGESNVLWRNNGNKTFTEWTGPTGLGGSGTTQAAMLTDFNNDRAVDIAVTGDGASPTLYINPREGRYPTQTLYDEKLPATEGIAVLDYNKDRWMDIAVTHVGAPGLTLWRNVAGPDGVGRRFVCVPLPLRGALRAWGVTPVDIDNDGWIDLAAIVETKDGPRVKVLRNLGNGSFADMSRALGLDRVKLHDPRGLIAGDVDGDGSPDLIVTQKDAAPVLLRNIGANKNHSVRLDLTGFADNKTALGVKVEIFADGQWQKWELAGASGFRTQGPPQILVGLGKADHINLLRILWPTGV
ncbi:MAG TPA: FG-GAP-like repeat-containing protein, partial [Terracidiphilus sp.]|nr:FG-GAP-like repeat-containing protein [Terracidiphilus sp.]